MNQIGSNIKKRRIEKGLTQEKLAEQLFVSSKAVSKWETGQGIPDISLMEPLAKALDISMIELFTGQSVVNRNRASDMRKAVCYICPICGNGLLALGQAVVSCCGITLPPMLAEDADDTPDPEHMITAEYNDGEYYVSVDHPMEKDHFISFLMAVSDNGCQFVKLYPESNAEARFRPDRVCKIYAYCNRHGMFCLKMNGARRR